jgi:hypothetical protein
MAVLTGNNQNLDFGRARRRVRALGVDLSSQDGHTKNSEEESSSVSHTISFILWRTKPAVKGLRTGTDWMTRSGMKRGFPGFHRPRGEVAVVVVVEKKP